MQGTGQGSWRRTISIVLGGLLCLFVLAEVNYPQLSTQLAVFAMVGLVLCFVRKPLSASPSMQKRRWLAHLIDGVLIAGSVFACGFVFVQSEPIFRSLWIGDVSLGNRAGQETALDIAVGVVGLIVILEATRRIIGRALPILSGVFLLYAYFGPYVPGWLFPHRGYGIPRIVAQSFLHSQGVFGTALRVMFVYVFLFVLLGALLKVTGASQFIVDAARRLLGGTPGGPAKVSVISSGLMGSLSGSAVANTATTGTFTIPMMKSSGFKSETAAGVEAAASSGGALVPPVMGAGAYMMLEIVEPAVTYVQIVKAALIPAILYYLSLFLIVHFHARKIGSEADEKNVVRRLDPYAGVVFVASIGALLVFLLMGYSVFRAASIALSVVLVISAVHKTTRLNARRILDALADAAKDAVPLIVAASCVGIIIGVVTLTGIGTKLPSRILDLAQGNMIAALLLIMVSSIILGMGLPSAVCYLLMATLIGPVLSELGIVPLAAHLFIFYFGLMSMVTPPVALAAYTASSIAGSDITRTGLAAFRFALVGFTLPYMFVFAPELLMMDRSGGAAGIGAIGAATLLAALGIVPFAAAIAGYLRRPLGVTWRALLFVSALLLLLPAEPAVVQWSMKGAGIVLLVVAGVRSRA